MPTRRTSHTVYDTKYHLVWAPKYRKWVLRGDIQDRVRELFLEIGDRHDVEIDTMEIAEDHVHLFVSFPPRLSISEVVGKMKAISAKVIFEEFPETKREMYGGRAQGRTDTLLEQSGTRSPRK
ncbi:IS200/IS605 family transposase [Salinibacter ruber]|uniref:IS200/IS605 family transposase n=1 Tax=Salinibacter ruber TaxID=146919 RepID=UPI003C6E9B46